MRKGEVEGEQLVLELLRFEVEVSVDCGMTTFE